MSHTTIGGHRRLATAITLLAGGGVAAATWVSGDHGWAIGIAAAFLVLAAGTFVWSGRSGDIAAVLRAGGDDDEETAIPIAQPWSPLTQVAAATPPPARMVVTVARRR